MKRNEIIGEHKKGVRAVKYNAKPQTHIEPPKPNNPVAKNANAAIGGGAAGAHKNEKKASQSVRGQKHKNADLAEVSLGDYRKKAAMQKAQSQMGAMFSRDPAEREKNLSTFNKREKGLNRLKARDERDRKAEQERQLASLVARLPELRAEYEQMKDEYKSLGGSNWQYADREQNLTDYERKARSMEGPMNNLWRQIQAAEKAQREQGVAEGERIKTPSGMYRDQHTGVAYRGKTGQDGNDSYMTPDYLIQKYQERLAQIAAGPYKRPKEVAQLKSRIAKLQGQQGVAEGSEKTKPNKPMTWQQAYAHNDGESFDARQKRITQYEKSKGEKKPKHVDWDKKGGMQEGVAEEIGYDEVDSKSASYILRKLDNGVSLSDLIDDFPELSRMIDDIAGERGLHADDNFEEIEDILRNDLEDIASQDDDFGDSMDDEDDFDEATGDAVGTISSATPDGKVKIKTATGSEIETNKDALIPGAGGTLQMKPDAAGDALKPGAKVVSTEGATEEDMLSHRADSASPISGDEDHDEMSKLLVMRLKRLAGL